MYHVVMHAVDQCTQQVQDVAVYSISVISRTHMLHCCKQTTLYLEETSNTRHCQDVDMLTVNDMTTIVLPKLCDIHVRDAAHSKPSLELFL